MSDGVKGLSAENVPPRQRRFSREWDFTFFALVREVVKPWVWGN